MTRSFTRELTPIQTPPADAKFLEKAPIRDRFLAEQRSLCKYPAPRKARQVDLGGLDLSNPCGCHSLRPKATDERLLVVLPAVGVVALLRPWHPRAA